MDHLLLEHLKGALAKSNVIAYVWDIGGDELHWLGDMESFAGHSGEQIRQNSNQFNLLLNPHDTPQRISDVQNYIDTARGKLDAGESVDEFSSKFKIRSGSGINIDVTETASLKHDDASGRLLLCGRLEKSVSQAAPEVVMPKEEANIARMAAGGGGHILIGRIKRAGIQHIEQVTC